jgi:hypothetical protein
LPQCNLPSYNEILRRFAPQNDSYSAKSTSLSNPNKHDK